MSEKEQLEWIGRYLRDELEDGELRQFEAQYRQNPAFAEAVDLQRELYATIGDKTLVELNAALNAALERSKPVSSGPPVALIIAGAVALAVLSGLVWFYASKESPAPAGDTPSPLRVQPQPAQPSVGVPPVETRRPPEQPAIASQAGYAPLAAAYYRQPAFPASGVRGDSSPVSFLDQAYRMYREASAAQRNGDRQSRMLFNDLIRFLQAPPDSVSLRAYYLRGHVYFHRQSFGQAAADFGRVAKVENEDQGSARWYLALSLLSLPGDNTDRAVAILTDIAEKGPLRYKSVAAELLVKVRSR